MGRLTVGQIKPNPHNPRIIRDDSFKKLVKSLQEFPEMADIRPVVVNKDNVILGGNMRYRAMKEAGWKEIPVKVVDLPEDKQREFIIKDNVSGGDWDWDLLANEWNQTELDDWGLELPEDWAEPEEVVEDEAPEVEDEVHSELGKIYQLGKHRVMCGDSTDKASVELLMNGERIDLLLTDPPYGIDYGGLLKGKGDGKGGADKNGWRSHDAPDWDKNRPPKECFDLMLELTEHKIIWGGNYFTDLVPPTMGWLVWDKGQRGFSLADGEIAWTSYNKAMRIKEYSRASANREEKNHPTQKPIEIINWCLEYAERHKTDTSKVLDLFLGSGSTLIACEQTDRICYGMELDPKYVDVIRKRYAKFCYPDTWEERWQELTPEISEGAVNG